MVDRFCKNRRAFLVASTAAFSVIGGRQLSAQQLPTQQQTIRYLDTYRSVSLLYNHFGLIWSVSVSVYLAQRSVTLDSVNDFDAEIPPFVDSGDIWPFLRDLAEPDKPEQRDSVRSLLEAVPDPVSGGERAEGHQRLVEKLSASISEAGIPTEAEVTSEAVESLSHVERIAAVTIDADNQDSYLCRIFPFKYFC